MREPVARGLAIFGWLVSYSYAIHLIGPYAHACSEGVTSPYVASLVWSAVTIGLAAALIATAPASSRFFLLPHFGTAAVGGWILARYFTRVTFEGRSICSAASYGNAWLNDSAVLWHRLYAPIHLILLGGFLVWAWRRTGGMTE